MWAVLCVFHINSLILVFFCVLTLIYLFVFNVTDDETNRVDRRKELFSPLSPDVHP